MRETGTFLKPRNDFPGRRDTRDRNPRKMVTHYSPVTVPAQEARESSQWPLKQDR